MKNLFTHNYLVFIFLLGFCIGGAGCNSISDIFQGEENNKLKNENVEFEIFFRFSFQFL